jgi:mitochondrial cardiolipin hydrolase
MGCFFSTLFPPENNDTAALQNRIRQLEQQLGQGGGGHGTGAGGRGSSTEVLFFPDPGMPCRFGASCRRQNCDYAHGATSLTRLLAILASARRTLDIAVFSLTCDEIASVLLDVHRRGVRVRLIIDDEQIASAGSDAASLRAAGVPVRHDGNRKNLMHHKFAVVDGSVVLTGSFNWTRSAVLFNDENILVLRGGGDGGAAAREYCRRFEAMWQKYQASERQPLPQYGGGDGGNGGGGGGGGGGSGRNNGAAMGAPSRSGPRR